MASRIPQLSSSGSKQRYPLATIAAYGRDNTRASKLVVSIVPKAGRPIREMREWNLDAGDVREDPAIAAEITDWLSEQHVRDRLSYDRIIGCPHEEGIDYPMGRVCPRCPFWACIDRFTHEPLLPPVATMSADEVLAELSKQHSTRLLEALESADAHRDALAGPLLRALEAGLADPDGLPEADAQLFTYALYLVAKWRETRAYPLVVRWLSLPGELAFDLAGDVVTQDGARILAAVCDGDLRPVRKLILNRDANEFGRSAGVSALTLLALWAEVPRDAILAELQWLAREGLEREPSFVWAALAGDCADIEMFEILPEIRRAFEDGLIDPMDVTLDEIEQDAASARGGLLETTRERYPPIDDIAEATSWFARAPSPERAERLAEMLAAGELDEPYDAVPIEPYRAPPKVGRNAPCPCGSGKKYKKCCGA